MINQYFLDYAMNAEQYSLNNELLVNVDYANIELSHFLLTDPRLPHHADVNFNKGCCLYVCKSKHMLKYLIIEAGLRLTPEMYLDIRRQKVNFPAETMKLFKISELHFKLKNKFPIKELKEHIIKI